MTSKPDKTPHSPVRGLARWARADEHDRIGGDALRSRGSGRLGDLLMAFGAALVLVAWSGGVKGQEIGPSKVVNAGQFRYPHVERTTPVPVYTAADCARKRLSKEHCAMEQRRLQRANARAARTREAREREAEDGRPRTWRELVASVAVDGCRSGDRMVMESGLDLIQGICEIEQRWKDGKWEDTCRFTDEGMYLKLRAEEHLRTCMRNTGLIAILSQSNAVERRRIERKIAAGLQLNEPRGMEAKTGGPRARSQ